MASPFKNIKHTHTLSLAHSYILVIWQPPSAYKSYVNEHECPFSYFTCVHMSLYLPHTYAHNTVHIRWTICLFVSIVILQISADCFIVHVSVTIVVIIHTSFWHSLISPKTKKKKKHNKKNYFM